MTKNELINLLNIKYPFSRKEEWDFCGALSNKYLNEKITGIFITLDMHEDSLNKAIKNNCNVIISHHPILIDDQNNIVNKNNKKIIKLLNKQHILNIALHTCYDSNKFGTSYQIYKLFSTKLSLSKPRYIKNIPYLITTSIKTKMTVKQLINNLKKIKSPFINNFRYINNDENKFIKTLCIGAGSCCSYINAVLKNNIDCFLTGDVKWHNYIDSYNNGLVIIDINHDLERVFINDINSLLKKNNHKLNLVCDYDYLKIINR